MPIVYNFAYLDEQSKKMIRRTKACAICGSRTSFLDEILTDDQGTRLFVCSDTEYSQRRKEAS
jgi:alpha-D-ribose 1-methylphosphonate 5-phosphate C-P lyase